MYILLQSGIWIFSILSLGVFLKRRGCTTQFVYLACAFCGYLLLSNVAPLLREEINFWYSIIYFASSLAVVTYFAYSSLRNTFRSIYRSSSAKHYQQKKLLSVDQFLSIIDSARKQEGTEPSPEEDLIKTAVTILEKISSKPS